MNPHPAHLFPFTPLHRFPSPICPPRSPLSYPIHSIPSLSLIRRGSVSDHHLKIGEVDAWYPMPGTLAWSLAVPSCPFPTLVRDELCCMVRQARPKAVCSYLNVHIKASVRCGECDMP